MHLAQNCVADVTHIAYVRQHLIIEHPGNRPQPPQEYWPLPLQWSLMSKTPCTFVVVLKHRFIGFTVIRMLDPPGLGFRVQGLLVKVLVYLHPGFTIDHVLPQSIGLNLRIERSVGLIGHHIRLP